VNMPFDAGYLSDPYAVTGRLRQEAPVHQVTGPDGQPLWLVTGYAEARAALADPGLSLDRRNSGGGYAGFSLPPALDRNLLNMDPPDHTRVRGAVGRAFTARRVEQLAPAVQLAADELLSRLEDAGGTADLMAGYALQLPLTVICDLLGVPAEARQDFRAWTNTLVAPRPGDDPRKAMAQMLAFLTALIAAKRAHPGDDLVSALVQARDDDARLGEEELVSLVFLILWAGYETAVDLIGSGLRAVLADQDLRAGLASGRHALPDVIEEILRFDGPAILSIRRFAAAGTEIGGTKIPAGDTVMISLAAANRDPARFDAPDTVDPERRDQGHLAFGHGIHHCLGAPLARAEGAIGIGTFLRRFPDARLAVPADALTWRPSIRTRGLASLPVILGAVPAAR
jgi:cytochrome P450